MDLSHHLNIDLWTLDALWWGIGDELDKSTNSENITSEKIEDPLIFGLEQYLHDFLRDNWERTDLGKEWDLYEEDGASKPFSSKAAAKGVEKLQECLTLTAFDADSRGVGPPWSGIG